jgi:multiple sugar transport system ATP-binding protein
VLAPYAGKEIDLGVRPENVLAEGDIPMKVFSNENLGMNTLVHGHIGGVETPSNKISAKFRGWCDYRDGDTASISFGRKHFFDKQTGEAIGREAKA